MKRQDQNQVPLNRHSGSCSVQSRYALTPAQLLACGRVHARGAKALLYCTDRNCLPPVRPDFLICASV